MTKNNLNKITSLFFTSRVRVKIMQLFYSYPEQRFHMREIARNINEQINAVRRELISMENSEFLLSQKDGIKKFFLINPDFAFYTEFRSIMAKNKPLGSNIFKNRKKLGFIKFAVLSNTYLRGEKSDINNLDLLIIGEPDLDILEACIKTSQEEEGKEIFYTVLSEKDLDARKKRRDTLIYSLTVLPKAMLIGSDEEFAI